MADGSLLHIVARAAWEEAVRAGGYRPASLASEGFIHFSTPAQVVATAERFYAGVRGLVLLKVDPARLSAELRWEEVPGHGTFPHLYGTLEPEAVTAVLPFEPGPDGRFELPAAAS